MSYASVAAHNAPPPSHQPHADPALLNTNPPTSNNVIDLTSKVNVVSPNFMKHSATHTPDPDALYLPDDDFPSPNPNGNKSKNRTSRRFQEAGAEGLYLWEVAKHYLFQPGVAGGLIGLVNVGLVAYTGRAFYTQPHLRHDRRIVSSTVAAAIGLVSLEGYAAEQYIKTPRGREEERRAKEEGTLIYKCLCEHILRPGVLGGVVGILNAIILGTVGYYSYINWDKPTWDRRTVSAVTIGLLTVWGGEGLIAAKYHKERRR